MDLRVYFQKIRTIESELEQEFPVIVSRATTDGGKSGVKAQVPRLLAARLVAEGKADLATVEETKAFLAQKAADWKTAEEEAKPDYYDDRPASRRARRPKKD